MKKVDLDSSYRASYYTQRVISLGSYHLPPVVIRGHPFHGEKRAEIFIAFSEWKKEISSTRSVCLAFSI